MGSPQCRSRQKPKPRALARGALDRHPRVSLGVERPREGTCPAQERCRCASVPVLPNFPSPTHSTLVITWTCRRVSIDKKSKSGHRRNQLMGGVAPCPRPLLARLSHSSGTALGVLFCIVRCCGQLPAAFRVSPIFRNFIHDSLVNAEPPAPTRAPSL